MRLRAALNAAIHIARLVERRLSDSQVMSLSAALSFRTIFALIPTLVIAFLAAKSLGSLEDSKRSLRAFLNASGFAQIAAIPDASTQPAGNGEPGPSTQAGEPGAVPASAPASAPTVVIDGGGGKVADGSLLEVINVAAKIEEVVESVEDKLTFERIGPIGAILLIWSALTLMMTIEYSLNRIFGAPESPAWVRRMLIYWSTLTLGPVILAAAVYIGRRTIETFHDAPVLSNFLVGVGVVGPVAVGVVLLTLVYMLVPNTRVPPLGAAAGATVAVLLWLVAKWGFSVYVAHFVLKGNLYGVLGVLPLFLLWLNISWTMFLLGAEVARLVSVPSSPAAAAPETPKWLGPTDALAVLLLVGQRFRRGDGAAREGDLGRDLGLAPELVRPLVDRLRDAGCVHAVPAVGAAEPGDVDRPDPAIVLARDPARIEVRSLPGWESGLPAAVLGENPVRAAAARVRAQVGNALGELTLADLLDDAPAPRAHADVDAPR